MKRFSMSNMALLMSYKVSSREIERIVSRLNIAPSDQADIAAPQEVRIAAVQLQLRRYSSLTDYITDMSRYVADAVNQKAQIVCFPAYTGWLPASLLPQFESTFSKLVPQPDTGLPDLTALGDCLSYYSDWMFDAYFYTMSALAARHRIWIMAGSTLYFEQDELRHRAFLFDKDGQLEGYQDKLSLSPLERQLQLDPAKELKLFETPVGPSVILTGEDAGYFEIGRVAHSMGARFIFHPAMILGEYTSMRSTLGLNMRCQEHPLWGIQSVLVGNTGLGRRAEGYACVFGPAVLTPKQNGLLLKTQARLEAEVLCTTMSLIRLESAHNSYRSDNNPAFWEKHFGNLY